LEADDQNPLPAGVPALCEQSLLVFTVVITQIEPYQLIRVCFHSVDISPIKADLHIFLNMGRIVVQLGNILPPEVSLYSIKWA
jgi:hypothetical protein